MRASRLWCFAVMAIVLGWGVVYVFHTSVVVDGPDGASLRVFTLWDDAMISMTYARNWVAGHGLVWSPGDAPVQGISNLGVTLFMALLHLLPVGPYHTSLLFQLACLGMLVAIHGLVFRLAAALVPGDAFVPALAVGVVALYAPLSVWSLQGSDVAPVALVTLLALVWVAERTQRGEPWPRGVFWLLAVGLLIRLDMSLVYAAFLGFCVVTSPRRVPDTLHGIAVLAAVCAGILGFGYLYYGDPLPNTFHLKGTGLPRAKMLASGLGQLWRMLGWSGLPVLVLGVACGVALLRRNRVARLVAATAAPAWAYVVWMGGDWLYQYHNRFLVPSVALYLILFVAAMRALLLRLLGESRIATPASRAALLALALVGLAGLFPTRAVREWWLLREATIYHPVNRENVELGLFLREHTAQETTVALQWAGIPAYFGERRGVDVLGMSDRHIARLSVDRFIPGHSKWDWDYVVNERRPDIVLRSSRGLGTRDDFVAGYYFVTAPGGVELMVRKGSMGRLRQEGIERRVMRAGRGPRRVERPDAPEGEAPGPQLP